MGFRQLILQTNGFKNPKHDHKGGEHKLFVLFLAYTLLSRRIKNIIFHEVFNSLSIFRRSWVFIKLRFFIPSWKETVKHFLALFIIVVEWKVTQIDLQSEVHELFHLIKVLNKFLFFQYWVECNLCIIKRFVLGHRRRVLFERWPVCIKIERQQRNLSLAIIKAIVRQTFKFNGVFQVRMNLVYHHLASFIDDAILLCWNLIWLLTGPFVICRCVSLRFLCNMLVILSFHAILAGVWLHWIMNILLDFERQNIRHL